MKYYFYPYQVHARKTLLQLIKTTLLDLLEGRKKPSAFDEQNMLEQQKRLLQKKDLEIKSIIDSILFKSRENRLSPPPASLSLKKIRIAKPKSKDKKAWYIKPYHTLETDFAYVDLLTEFGELGLKPKNLEKLFEGFERADKLINLIRKYDEEFEDVFEEDNRIYEQGFRQAMQEVIDGILEAEPGDDAPLDDRARRIKQAIVGLSKNKPVNDTGEMGHIERNVLAALLFEANIKRDKVFDLLRPGHIVSKKDDSARGYANEGKKLIAKDPSLRTRFQPKANKLINQARKTK